jgi:hypothetical protein
MSSKKSGGTARRKPYSGPWPEQHPSIPGRVARTGEGKDKGSLPGHPNAAQIQKIPPQAPK